MNYTIRSVQTARDKKDFLEVARVIYRNDSNWICPLDKQIHNIFEHGKNDYLNNGHAARWILLDEHNNFAGRIAAFVHDVKKKNTDLRSGGVGFFECVDDQQAANLLFDTARQWLEQHNVESMDGPINFGENDQFWGLLVEGFTEPPFTTNYHPSYYRALFENYGFRPHYEMVSSAVYADNAFDERFERIWSWIKQKDDVEFRNPALNEIDQYAQYFREIYNEAWQFHEDYKPITEQRAKKFAKEIRMLFVQQMIVFAFVRNEPAGFLVCTPDMNQIFKKFNGRISPVQLLLFLWRKRNNFAWYIKNGILNRGHGIAIGIKPKFQQYGLETGLIMSARNGICDLGFKSLELRWAGDFNPKVNRLHKAMGAEKVRKHITYRFLFDENAAFNRYTTIGMGRGKVGIEGQD